MPNAELTQAGMALPAEARLDLARRLVESVALPEPLTPAIAEGIRRIEDVATGRIPGLPEEHLRAGRFCVGVDVRRLKLNSSFRPN